MAIGVRLLIGIIDVTLGMLIWQELPASALWGIGLFAEINLRVPAVIKVALGLALRSRTRPQTT